MFRPVSLFACFLMGVTAPELASGRPNTPRLPVVSAPLSYVSHGVICNASGGRIVRNQDTIDGEVIETFHNRDPIQILTATAPARTGLAIMVNFIVDHGTPPKTLSATVDHPPMGPNGLTRQSWTVDVVGGDVKGIGYRLEDPFEEVPGPWTFTLKDRAKTVLSMTFDMVPTGAAPHVEDVCFPDTVPRS